MYCIKCGTKQNEGEKFCPNCGTQFALNEDIVAQEENSSDTDFLDDNIEIQDDSIEDLEPNKYKIYIYGIIFITAIIFYFFADNLWIACSIIVILTVIHVLFKIPIKKIIIILFLGLLTGGLGSNIIRGDKQTSKYDKEGYDFLLNTLKAPSEAKLLSYISKANLRESIKKHYNITYSQNLDFEYFEMECMNGFGGRARTDFVVVYWKNKAVLCDEMSPDYLFSSPEGLHNLRLLLDLNLGLDDNDVEIKKNQQ